MDIYKLEKPNIINLDTGELFHRFTKNPEVVLDAINKINEPTYRHWDKVKYIEPPKGYSSEEFWYLAKQIRNANYRKTPIKAESGAFFRWMRLNYTDEYLHNIDMELGGQIFTHYSDLITPINRQRLLTKGIIEEAIASSQLEGANTTTPAAKRMLLENRQPKDKSEQMIVNNYKTIKALEEDYKEKKLSKDMLFEMHRLITKDTLDTEKQGRYRKDKENIVVADATKLIYHVPPKENFVDSQIDKLIKYANDEDDDSFTHPIIKAIFLHFWIGYLHPFYDGNGRLARTIFYWYLLRKNYWAIMYIPISLAIKKAPSQYGMAYVYSEQDDFDLTYFYDFHIRKIVESLKDFNNYVLRKTQENKKTEKLLHTNFTLNERQKQVLHYLIVRDESGYTTPSAHQTLYGISRPTAISDLKDLERKGLVISKKVGLYVKYYATNKLRNLQA